MEVKLYTQAYISENVTCNIFDNNEVIKKIEYQIHKNRVGELFYHYYTTAGSLQVFLAQNNDNSSV